MTSLMFIDQAMARLGFTKTFEELTFEEAERVFNLAEEMYADWSEDMMASDEYNQLCNPGLQA